MSLKIAHDINHYLYLKKLNFETLKKSMVKCFSGIPDSRQQGKCICSQHDVLSHNQCA